MRNDHRVRKSYLSRIRAQSRSHTYMYATMILYAILSPSCLGVRGKEESLGAHSSLKGARLLGLPIQRGVP